MITHLLIGLASFVLGILVYDYILIKRYGLNYWDVVKSALKYWFKRG